MSNISVVPESENIAAALVAQMFRCVRSIPELFLKEKLLKMFTL